MGKVSANHIQNKRLRAWLFLSTVLLNGVLSLLNAQVSSTESRVYIHMQYNPKHNLALMDIEPDVSKVRLSLTPSLEAGLPISDNPTPTINSQSTDNSKWINYSAWTIQIGSAYKIVAQISSLMDGIDLHVEAGQAVGAQGSGIGTPTGKVKLGQLQKDIITSISYAVTGNGINHGHQLTYSLSISDVTKISKVSNKSTTVTYTMLDE